MVVVAVFVFVVDVINVTIRHTTSGCTNMKSSNPALSSTSSFRSQMVSAQNLPSLETQPSSSVYSTAWIFDAYGVEDDILSSASARTLPSFDVNG
jgi:hypothetical protein